MIKKNIQLGLNYIYLNLCISTYVYAKIICIVFWSKLCRLACIIAIILYAVGGAKQYGVEFPEIGHLLYSNYWQNISVDNTRCYKVKHGTFAGAAAASFGALLLGILSYLPLISERRRRRRRFHARGTSTDSHSHDI